MANRVKNNTSSTTEVVLTKVDLRTEKGLSAKEVDRRLFTLARAHRRVESTLSYYFKEVEERQLYLQYGFANTVDYARERLGFEERKTRSLLNIAHSFENCSHLKKAFQNGDIKSHHSEKPGRSRRGLEQTPGVCRLSFGDNRAEAQSQWSGSGRAHLGRAVRRDRKTSPFIPRDTKGKGGAACCKRA